MSDTPSSYAPPPPPSNLPPPAAPSGPGFAAPPGYPGSVTPGYSPPPAPLAAAGVVAGGAGALLYQFGGPAIASIIAGVISIALPFVANRYFILLPIAGLLSGVRALQRGRLIGGVVGIVLNLIGGLVSLLASGVFGGT